MKEAPLCPDTPGDFHSDFVGAARNLTNLQHDFDVYSWETFIALNWPADDQGNPSGTVKIGDGPNGDHLGVWETWKDVQEVFYPDGREPGRWGSPPEIPAPWNKILGDKSSYLIGPEGRSIDVLSAVTQQHYKFLSRIAKGYAWRTPQQPFIYQTDAEQPFNSGPLIDQNGHYARFDIMINRDMFNYIVYNHLYNKDGQVRFAGDIVFPFGRFEKTAGPDGVTVDVTNQFGKPVTERVGAIVVKAAWKVLTKEEANSGRYHVRNAILCTPPDPITTLDKPLTQIVKVGLVGMHIVHKSEDVPQWNWSTFEQVDNCPEVGVANTNRTVFNFFCPGAPERSINTPPNRPWDPAQEEPPERRAQIVRTIPINAEVKDLNDSYHERLRTINAKSVWQYYQLVNTQWPTRPARSKRSDPNQGNVPKVSPADILGGPAPVFVANTTLESYIQGTVPNTSSSCMECHANSTAQNGRFSDFTYVLERANPLLKQGP